jgi:hypothetical protein
MSTTPTPQPPSPIQAVSRSQIRFVEVLGIFLALVGLIALIELYPRPTPSANLPTDSNDPLSSSRFTITNDGYVRLADVKAACYMWKLQYGGRFTVNMPGSFANIVSPPEKILQTSEGLTVPCTTRRPIESVYEPPTLIQADVAIAFYYRPWPIPFLRCHRLFRFVARFNDKGEIVGWDKQPAGVLEPDFEKFMKWRKSQPSLPQL